MKKLLFILFFTVFSLVASSSAFAEQIDNFKVNIDINKNGTINVSEEIDYNFGDLQKHGIYRKIPYTKTNAEGKKFRMNFDQISVTDPQGKSYTYEKSTSGDNISLKIGDANKTITGLHTYIIKYRVSGALTYFLDHDELYWNATGNEWEVPIAAASVFIALPETVDSQKIQESCFTGYSGSTDSNCISSFEIQTAVFTSDTFLAQNQGMTVILGFPKGIAAVLEPKEVVSFFSTFLGKIVLAFIVLLIILWYIVYPIWLFIKWYRYGRDPKVGGPVSAWFDPPKNEKGQFLTPAETGTLVDERVDMRDVAATVVDLARRGYFIIEERKKNDFYLIKKKDYFSDTTLKSYERDLLEAIFSTEDEVRLKDKKLYSEIQKVEKDIYEKMVRQGFFPSNPKKNRDFYTAIMGAAMATFNIFLVLSAATFGRAMSKRTLFGAQQNSVAKSLENFLTSQSEQLAFQAKNQMMFEKLLPFAIVFGVEKIWAKRFKDIKLQNPEWFQSYNQRAFNSVYFANTLNSSLSSFTSSAAPTSSSSGFSSGFSGGGSSGGGGGGGGGGSW